MESTSIDNDLDKEMVILRFMEVTQCETYEKAKFFVAMHGYKIKDSVSAYMTSKGHSGYVSNCTDNGCLSPNLRKTPLQQTKTEQDHYQLSLSPEQALVLQKRLRSKSRLSQRSNDDFNHFMNEYGLANKGICNRLFRSCIHSFKCLDKLKKQLKRKVNSMKKDADRIYYFQQLYHSQLEEGGIQIQNTSIQGYQLTQIEESQKIKMLINNQQSQLKPIFVLICPNRSSQLISNFLRNIQLMTFIRQHFEPLLITLSQLKELNLKRSHAIRNIRKCPTVMVYMKNIYDLDDILVSFEGEGLKGVTVEKLREGLDRVPNLLKKWTYMMNFQRHLRESAITSLNQVVYEDQDDNYHDISHQDSVYTKNQRSYEHPQTKLSLIQQQTQIYQQLVAEQAKRKNSIQLQKRKIQEIKQLRQIRKLSLPEQPPAQLFSNSIQFKFRCPLNGEYISRRFLRDEKIDILYQFVDTTDKVEFETQPERNFDLCTSFPPNSLSEKRQFLIRDVFDQEKQNIFIREI